MTTTHTNPEAPRRPVSTADLANASHRQSDDAGSSEAGSAETAIAPLFGETEMAHLRQRWDAVQGEFVDAPRDAVQDADSLVAETMAHLAEVFASERAQLEDQWSRGDDVTTEDLRVALQRYRSFFTRLLNV